MSNLAESLMQSLQRGEKILMDGAMGTEIERRGVAVDDLTWSAAAHHDQTRLVEDIHADYIAAGARLHIANSFAMSRHVLALGQKEAAFEQLNRQTVQLFDQAVAKLAIDRSSVWLAGSVSTFYAGSDRGKLPSLAVLERNSAEQAGILADAGVDAIALEMLFDTEVTLAMWRAVAGLGLPVILGFTCDDSGLGDSVMTRAGSMGATPRLLDEVLSQVLAQIDPNTAIPAIMHSDPAVTGQALDILLERWAGPVAAYPNSGVMHSVHQDFASVCSADEFAGWTISWFQKGVSIVGGCCGVGPAHIRAAAQTGH